MKLQLPDGRCCGKISVHPKNWNKPGVSITDDWYIFYRIYSPGKKPLQVVIKGMNEFKTLSERRAATSAAIEQEILMLTKGNEILELDQNRSMPIIKALTLARGKLKYEHKVLLDIDSVIRGLEKAAKALRLEELKISEVSRKHLKLMLEKLFTLNKRFSAKRFNQYRTYLSACFKELVEMEAIDTNPIRDISKMKTVRKLRVLPSNEEIRQIDEYIAIKSYEFWRYMRIFFYSGARTTELFRIKKEAVRLDRQEFTVTVIKGKNCSESIRQISDEAVDLWKELMEQATPRQYLFSKWLCPGDRPIRADQVGRRWYNYVKRDLGLNINFYTLKAMFADALAEKFDIGHASVADGHTNTKTTELFYAVGEKKRKMKRIREAKIQFVKKTVTM